MARRSAANERYQKYTGPKGQTRKSASQAKPKRSSSGPTSPTGSKSGSKPSTKGKGSSAARPKIPETPEYLAARKLWWTLLIIGLVMTAASWLIRAYVHTTWANGASAVALGLAYSMIFYALYIDWTRLRPARKAMLPGKSAPKPAEKAEKAEKSPSKKPSSAPATPDSVTTVEEHDSADRKDA